MKLLKGFLGGLCLCTAIGCTAPASQKENVVAAEGLSQSEAVIKTIIPSWNAAASASTNRRP